MSIARSAGASSSWVMILFGLPFLAVGIGVLAWSGRMWALYHRSGEWKRVPATILSVELRTHRGDDSTSYSVDCRYVYTVAGRDYEGTRVGIEGGGGSSDGYHSRRYALLARHRDAKTPFEARVNPAAPEESLLFRELTTTVYVLPLFGLVFALAGLGVSSAGVYATARSRVTRARLALNPGRPWRSIRGWQTFQVHDSPGRKIAGAIGLSVFMGLFISVFAVVLHGAEAPFFVRLIVGGFALVPVGAFVAAVYYALRYVKYGRASLVFRQLPFVIGRENDAILYVRTPVMATDGTELTLQCVRKVWVKRGNKTAEEEEVVYGETKKAQVDLAGRTGRGSAIPVQFAIPAGLPQTQTVEYPRHLWRLTAKAAAPGIDFSAQFEIPVYTVTDPALIDRNPLAGR